MSEYINFAEYSVEKKFEGKYGRNKKIATALYVCVPIIVLFASVALIGAGAVIWFVPLCPTLLAIIIPLVNNRFFKIEYDYSVSAGELRIAEVRNKRSRKELITVDIKKAESIAPYRDKYRESADRVSYDKIIDASSSCESPDLYYLVTADEEDEKSKTIIFFEPTAKMLSLLCSWNKRTVKTEVRF